MLHLSNVTSRKTAELVSSEAQEGVLLNGTGRKHNLILNSNSQASAKFASNSLTESTKCTQTDGAMYQPTNEN